MSITDIYGACSGPGMKVFVKSISGTLIPIEVDISDTIEDVKVKIRSKDRTWHYSKRLVFNGRLLEERRTLADYNIRNNSTLCVALDFCKCLFLFIL